MQLVRDQQIEVNLSPLSPSVEVQPINPHVILSRAQRAHTRLSWETRFARNARREPLGQVTIKLFGVPTHVARGLCLTVGERA
jgi:hypothetical protein